MADNKNQSSGNKAVDAQRERDNAEKRTHRTGEGQPVKGRDVDEEKNRDQTQKNQDDQKGGGGSAD